MEINLKSIDGNKTYLSIAAYAMYLIALKHGYIQPIPDLEVILKSAIGAAFAHKVSKLIPDKTDPPTPPTAA